MTSSGKEGLILNRDTKYQIKRNFGILKIKKFQTVDLRIKAIEEGEGKCANKMGVLTVDYKGTELCVGQASQISSVRCFGRKSRRDCRAVARFALLRKFVEE
jgi:FKBP-type peptidyl-prolyl cis-trans isomerase